MSADFDIDEELGRLGFVSAEARRTARAVLEEARLTRPGRRRMAVEKRDRLREALEQRFLFLCAECLQEAPNGNGRERVAVAPEQCSECGGSANRREAARLAEALRAAGKRRLLIVGGSPGTRQDLKRQLAGAAELRMIEGSGGVRRRDADRHIAWADLVVVWGPTELAHRVSNLFTESALARGKLVQVPRRGVAALCRQVRLHLARSRP
ncbi:MAG TPA: hypothetical protein VNM43_06650 [Dehalococcoidia bacterium]|nr:hypothetical protein [Dehalococcoidia bacterium]